MASALLVLLLCLITRSAAQGDFKVVGKISDLTNTLSGSETEIKVTVTNQESLAYDEFQKFTSLTVLRIEHGSLKSFDPATFRNMTTLDYLSLFNNSIENLPPRPFPPSLTNLDLGSNNIKTIPRYAFQRLPNLQVLRLHRNSIQSIATSVGPVGAFDRNNKIQTLELKGNDLQKFPENLMFPELTKLTLDENQIPELKATMLTGLPKLQTLTMTHNKIQTIRDDMATVVKKLAPIALQNNPIHCNCYTKWMISESRIKNKVGASKCATPLVESLARSKHECQAPSIISQHRDMYVEQGEDFNVECEASGDPAPSIMIFNGSTPVTTVPPPPGPLSNKENSGVATFKAETNATIICQAKNIEGEVNKTTSMFVIPPRPQEQISPTGGDQPAGGDDTMMYVGIGVGVAVAIIAAVGIAVYVVKKKGREQVGPIIVKEESAMPSVG